MTNDCTIRPATPADYPAIAELHVRSWAKAYDGEFPGETLPPEVTGALARSWTEHEPKDSDVVLVVDMDGEVVGFAAVWCNPEPYVDNLHVMAKASGAGVGQRLVREMVKGIRERGHNALSLTVFESNSDARAFYAKLGGTESEVFTVAIFGIQVNCHTVRWSDLSALA